MVRDCKLHIQPPRLRTAPCWLSAIVCLMYVLKLRVQGCIQKFPDWPPGARTANGTALCHSVQLYRYFVSQSSEFCRYNPLCYFSTSVYRCKHILRYRLSPKTFGYTLVYEALRNGCGSPNIIRLVKSRTMRLAGHVTGIGEMQNAYKILVVKLEEQRPLGRPRSCR
jgi:hypothetical protein